DSPLGVIFSGLKTPVEKWGFFVKTWIGSQRFIHLRKVTAHAGTEVRQRTPRIDKGHQQYLAAKLRQVNLLIALVQQPEIRYLIARLNGMVEKAWLIVRF